MMDTIITRYCYSAAIIRPEDGALLIVQRASHETSFAGHWELPGGHAEKGESILNTLRRKVREETKLDIYVPALDPYFGFVYDAGKLELHFIVHAEGEPVLNPKEHQAFQWIVDKAQLDGLPISPTMRQSLEQALGRAR